MNTTSISRARNEELEPPPVALPLERLEARLTGGGNRLLGVVWSDCADPVGLFLTAAIWPSSLPVAPSDREAGMVRGSVDLAGD